MAVRRLQAVYGNQQRLLPAARPPATVVGAARDADKPRAGLGPEVAPSRIFFRDLGAPKSPRKFREIWAAGRLADSTAFFRRIANFISACGSVIQSRRFSGSTASATSKDEIRAMS